MDSVAWWAAVHGVSKSWTRLSDFTVNFHFHALEKEMATHSSTLAWHIPWTEEPGRLQSMGSLGVGHDWATSLPLIGEGNGTPLQCSCLENPRDGGAWWAAVFGVTQSLTWLKWLSSRAHFSFLLRQNPYFSQCPMHLEAFQSGWWEQTQFLTLGESWECSL